MDSPRSGIKPQPTSKEECAGEAQQEFKKMRSDIRRMEAPATKGLREVLLRSKDATLAFTARLAINTKLRSIGNMTELSIDTKNKRVRVRLELLGEQEPIDIDISRYSLKEKGATTYITIEEATSSREWLTVALREFVVGQDWAIPAKADAVLKLLI
jgi:hypothetical protein